MAVTSNPNYWPFASAAFCRPNWLPSQVVQEKANDLLAVSDKRRQITQNDLNAKMRRVQAANMATEGLARAELIRLQGKDCGCAAPIYTAPEFILQPTPVTPRVLIPNTHAARPGGIIGDALNAVGNTYNAAATTVKNAVDDTADYVAQTTGAAVCETLKQTGMLENSKDLATQVTRLQDFAASQPPGYQYLVDVVAGGVPFAVAQLIEECDVGPALKTFALSEYRRMQIAQVTLNSMAAISAVPAATAGLATAGVTLAAPATLAAAAALAGALSEFYKAIANSQWLSFDIIMNMISAVAGVYSADPNGTVPDSLKDVIETANTVEEAKTEAQAAISSLTAGGEESEKIIQAIFAHAGPNVIAGTLANPDTAVQPGPDAPYLSTFLASPNPLLTRSVAVSATAQNIDYIPPARPKEEGVVLPLAALGLLLQVL